MTIDIAATRSRLAARLAELDADMARLEADTSQALDPDFAEQANELEDLETNEALEKAHMAEARAIAAAIRRIDTGTYGVCARCGEAIAPARLEAQPASTLCIGCAT